MGNILSFLSKLRNLEYLFRVLTLQSAGQEHRQEEKKAVNLSIYQSCTGEQYQEGLTIDVTLEQVSKKSGGAVLGHTAVGFHVKRLC
ncbi:hypothetical protein TNCV_1633731 [Trichonephila clavipes]|nr:hypothetical protein TNCV_1633731 [Trichonephila clavipes]